MIGLCIRHNNWEMGAALRSGVGCDAPTPDLIEMRTDSLLGPGHKTQHRWALLLYTAEFEERSKI